jgi:hypothetical protein
VNRATPLHNIMLGVLNRVGTTQAAWDWATVTSGGGTDSLAWTWNWNTDSLIPGENFLCLEPLEADAATTNNEGVGSPFAGNPTIYPMYRVGLASEGVAERTSGPGIPSLTIAPNPFHSQTRVSYEVAAPGPVAISVYDITGRLVRTLTSGPHKPGTYNLTWDGKDNESRTLAEGVYFIRLETLSKSLSRKVVLAR